MADVIDIGVPDGESDPPAQVRTPQLRWPPSGEEAMGDLVHFDRVKLIRLDLSGRELDDAPERGYLVYNDHYREFGWRSFEESDFYTLGSDVLQQIELNHVRLMRYVQATGGFYLSGRWCALGPDGSVVH
ncbi:MAG: hypothetical protein IRZ33_10090 [Alicyclobacillaceae bacterium]|nr:hypothetical protein [Alicyclobacillaceae bacterium]